MGFNNFVLLTSGALGGLSYVLKKEMSLWQRVLIIIMGGASSLLLTPLVIYWLDLPGSTQISGGVGYLIGMFAIELMETFFKLFDTLQENPKFIFEIIAKRFKK